MVVGLLCALFGLLAVDVRFGTAIFRGRRLGGIVGDADGCGALDRSPADGVGNGIVVGGRHRSHVHRLREGRKSLWRRSEG